MYVPERSSQVIGNRVGKCPLIPSSVQRASPRRSIVLPCEALRSIEVAVELEYLSLGALSLGNVALSARIV